MNTTLRLGLAVAAAAVCLPCRSADPAAPPAAPRPAVVFITDFHLDADQIESKGLLGRERRGILGGIRPGILRGDDPEDKSRELVRVLTAAIIRHLRGAGVDAEYLPGLTAAYVPMETDGRIVFAPGGPPLPAAGWLVTGWFEEVQEGSAAVQATVGFGAGSGKAEAAVAVSDLARDPCQPLMVMGSGSRTRHMPGGLITKNPYVMAAKFVMDKRRGTEKEVQSLGADIAKSLLAGMNGGATRPAAAGP